MRGAEYDASVDRLGEKRWMTDLDDFAIPSLLGFCVLQFFHSFEHTHIIAALMTALLDHLKPPMRDNSISPCC